MPIRNFLLPASDTSRLATAQRSRSMFCCPEKLKMARTPPLSNTRAMHQATPTTLRSANYSRHSAMPMSQSTCAAPAARAVRSVTSKNLNHSMATTPLKQSPHNHGCSITKSAWSALVIPASASFSWLQHNRRASLPSRHSLSLTTALAARFVPAEF